VQVVLAIASVDRSERSKIDISPKHDPGFSTASASSPEPGIVREIRTSPSEIRKAGCPAPPSLKTYWPTVKLLFAAHFRDPGQLAVVEILEDGRLFEQLEVHGG